MDLGNSIALGSFFVTAGGVAIAAICSRSKKDCSTEVCQEHSGIQASIKNIEGWMQNIDEKVTLLLRNGKGQ